MKKRFLLGVAACLFASLAGCREEPDNLTASMCLEPAQLTQEEQNIADLLGASAEHPIFDFTVDESVQSLQINTYVLSNGKWELISGGGGQAFSDPQGRIALGFDKIAEGVRVAVQSENTIGSTSYTCDPGEEFEGMGCATSFLSSQTEIVYEQEIPLAVQIVTAKNQITSYAVDFFSRPEEYAGYEHVYAITVRFSRHPVSELSSIDTTFFCRPSSTRTLSPPVQPSAAAFFFACQGGLLPSPRALFTAWL